MDERVAVRILQLKNNFFCDGESRREKPLGEFCTWGYFDAFDISEQNIVIDQKMNTWEEMMKLTYRSEDDVNCRMLVCGTEAIEKDGSFWENSEGKPLFFITMARVDKTKTTINLREVKNQLDNNDDSIVYWSYDHSELVIITKTKKYSAGLEKVRYIRKKNPILKTYTFFAMREQSLVPGMERMIENEMVCCRMRCIVKDYTCAEIFISSLERALSCTNGGKKICIRKFETFGGYDWLMEIDQIEICSLLQFYRTNELLTHANVRYSMAFYNIESEILLLEDNVYEIMDDREKE